MPLSISVDFRRKMFAIHDKVELLKRDNRPLGSYARHYYDLARLAATKEVQRCWIRRVCRDQGGLRQDQQRVFYQELPTAGGLSFANSDALFPGEALSVDLGKEYEMQCRVLVMRPTQDGMKSSGCLPNSGANLTERQTKTRPKTRFTRAGPAPLLPDRLRILSSKSQRKSPGRANCNPRDAADPHHGVNIEFGEAPMGDIDAVE